MDARYLRIALAAVVVVISLGAAHRTKNFVVNAPDAKLAAVVAEAAERYRRDLAVSWLGQALPDWSSPCVTTIRVGENLGAGGATTFMFDRGEVYGWRMNIQGSHRRLLDSVLPHEITHTIMATHFRCPLPRWADEGAATSVEHISERTKYYQMLHQFLRSGRGIAFSQMFAMSEYPEDVLPLYSQGFTLADFLIQHGGRQKFVTFIEDGLSDGRWVQAIERNYPWQDLGTLQNDWLAWVEKGCPAISPENIGPNAGGQMLAAAQPRSASGSVPMQLASASAKLPRPEPNLIFRIPNSATPSRPTSSQSSRPQGVQKSEQIILEWRNR